MCSQECGGVVMSITTAVVMVGHTTATNRLAVPVTPLYLKSLACMGIYNMYKYMYHDFNK